MPSTTHRGSRPSSRLAATASRSGSAPGARRRSGTELREYRGAGDVYRVSYEVDGRRHTSVVAQDDLSVQVAGICLSGEDHSFRPAKPGRRAPRGSPGGCGGTRRTRERRDAGGSLLGRPSARTLNPVVEQCWILVGARRGRIWLAQCINHRRGEPSSVRDRRPERPGSRGTERRRPRVLPYAPERTAPAQHPRRPDHASLVLGLRQAPPVCDPQSQRELASFRFDVDASRGIPLAEVQLFPRGAIRWSGRSCPISSFMSESTAAPIPSSGWPRSRSCSAVREPWARCSPTTWHARAFATGRSSTGTASKSITSARSFTARAKLAAWKVEVLRGRIFRSVGVEIEPIGKELTERNARSLLKGSGLVIDTFDNSSSTARAGSVSSQGHSVPPCRPLRGLRRGHLGRSLPGPPRRGRRRLAGIPWPGTSCSWPSRWPQNR